MKALPSLKNDASEVFVEFCYLAARLQAARETGIDFTLFPATPFTIEQMLDKGFLPKEPDLYDQS